MDNNKPVFIMMVGLPYSGKSEHAKVLAKEYNAVIHSSDALRAELFGDSSDQRHNAKVFEVLLRRIRTDIHKGQSVIFDATNISYKRRTHTIQSLGKADCKKICVFMATPFDVCVERRKLRDRVVGYEVLERMYKNIWVPYWYEGWDEIKLVYLENTEFISDHDLFLRMRDIPHDNPNHRLSIGLHCLATAVNLSEKFGGNRELERFGGSGELAMAAFLHDIGKPFTKSFVNSKGITTDVAHYYNHHHVSAYDSFFCFGRGEWHLYVATVIQWHMHPYEIERLPIELQADALFKFRKRVGDKLYSDIMLLHQADVKAR